MTTQDLKVYAQEVDGTCGPVSLRMALTCFGIYVSERELVYRCRTWLGILDSIYFGGTRHTHLAEAAAGYRQVRRFSYETEWEVLVATLSPRTPGIVEWISDRDWDQADCHYSVAIEAGGDWITLADPQFGDVWTCSREHFERKWLGFGHDGGEAHRFLLALA